MTTIQSLPPIVVASAVFLMIFIAACILAYCETRREERRRRDEAEQDRKDALDVSRLPPLRLTQAELDAIPHRRDVPNEELNLDNIGFRFKFDGVGGWIVAEIVRPDDVLASQWCGLLSGPEVPMNRYRAEVVKVVEAA